MMHILVACRSRVICKKVASQSGHKAKLEVAPPGPKKARNAFLFALGATSTLALCPDCDATFLQMTRLLHVTSHIFFSHILFSHLILFSHICLVTFRGLPPSRGLPIVRDCRFDGFFEKQAINLVNNKQLIRYNMIVITIT